MAKKVKLERCCICEKILDNDEKVIKVKEKVLYEDNGIWYNFKTSYICSSCLNEIKNKIKAQV